MGKCRILFPWITRYNLIYYRKGIKFDFMKDRTEILDFFHTYKDHLIEKYQLKEIALFGSYARQEHTENSDIDLLIEFNDDVSEIRRKKLDLSNEISEKFNLKVDICRDKYIKDCFRQFIYKDAIYF